MKSWHTAIVLLAAFGLLAALGCGSDPRTSNQGGGSIISATSKLNEGAIGDMTADELQILGDAATTWGGMEIPMLSDDDAGLIVDFLDENEIDTIDELTAALQSGELEIPDELLALVSSMG